MHRINNTVHCNKDGGNNSQLKFILELHGSTYVQSFSINTYSTVNIIFLPDDSYIFFSLAYLL